MAEREGPQGPNDKPGESEDGSVSEVRRSEGGPTEGMGPMGQLADMVLASFELMAKPEGLEDARMVILIDTDGEGILSAVGYDDDAEVISAALRHIKAMLVAHGTDLEVIGGDELREMFSGGQN